MSLDKSAAIVSIGKLLASASCNVCGKFYAEPRLAACGDRICASCGKNSTECLICKDKLDPDYLQEDPLMHKLALSVRKNLEKFQKLEDVGEKKLLNESWQSGKLNASKRVSFVKSINADSPVCNDNLRVVMKRINQEDFDKIEYFEESLPTSTNGTERLKRECNAVEHETFIQKTEGYEPTQDLHEEKVTNKVITEAVVETGNPKSIEITLKNKKSSSKFSKPSNWKNVRKMDKELGKIKKKNVKKLNVSIEMCKKTQAVISKAQTSYNDDLTVVIEDTPQFDTLPEVILDDQQKEEKENSIPSKDRQKVAIECTETQKKNKPVVILSNVLLPHLNIQENESAPQHLTSLVNIDHNNSSSENIDTIAKTDQIDSDKSLNIQRNNLGSVRKRKMRQDREAKVKARPSIPTKRRLMKVESVRFKRKISIVNISTPEGRFVITGRNIFVQKSLVARVHPNKRIYVDASTNTVVENDVTKIHQSKNTLLSSSIKTVSYSDIPPVHQINKIHVDVSTNTVSKNLRTENNQDNTNSPVKEISMPKTCNNSTKPNTASQQTTSGPYKITESVEKELNKEMDVIEDLDIFNSCSGTKNLDTAASRDLFHTQLVEASCQKSEGIKRQIEKEYEPSRKKVKSCNNYNSQTSLNNVVSFPPTIPYTENNEQATPENGSYKISHEKMEKHDICENIETNKYHDPLTNDFDEITSAALFAQIDADLRDEESKKYSHKNMEVDLASDVEDEQEVLGLKTPKSTQNVTNVDSDSSFVEETPQKEKPSKIMSSNLAEISSNTKKTSKVDSPARSPAAPIAASTESPLTQTFQHGISDESTPLRAAPRRSLNFNQVQDGDEMCSKIGSDSINGEAKNTLEKEFMEEAFEKTQVTPVRRAISLRKVSSPEAKKGQIACSVLTQYERAEVSRFAKQFKWDLVEQYTQSLTHLIVGIEDGKAQRTVKYMQAIAAGKWILSFQWIKECLKKNKIVDEAPYEVLDMTGDNGPYLSRTAKRKLFEGMLFYCHPPFAVMEQAALEDILRAAGGRVVRTIEAVSVRHTTQIALLIAEPQSTVDQDYTYMAIQKCVVPVNYEWVLNCLGGYGLQPLELLCPGTIVLQAHLAWPQHLLDFDNEETQ